MSSRGPSSSGMQAPGAWAPVVPAQVERRPQVHELPWSQLRWTQAPGAWAPVVPAQVETGPRCVGSRGSTQGPSGCGARALVAPQNMEFSWTRDRTRVLCIGRQIPVLCTT